LVWFYPEDRVDLHSLDAEPLQISDGDTVRLITESGEALAKARLTDDNPRGAVAFTSHFESTQLLAAASNDTDSHTPSIKALRVRLEKA
jgi:predicted molibdopterin-dependent oxidoreductase YjgC